MRRFIFEYFIPENDYLNGCLEEINSEFVEREATPRLLMKLGIQLHLTFISFSNTFYNIEILVSNAFDQPFIIGFTRSINSPKLGRYPDHVVVDETVVRVNDEQYWLYAAVDPGTNKLLHTKLEPTTTKALTHSFLTELSEKHGVRDIVFLVDGSHALQDACHRHGFDFRYEKHGNRNAVERIFRGIKGRTICFSNCFTNAEAETADDWLRPFSFA